MSYYINLVLEGVGITSTETKAAINGGLQVRLLSFAFFRLGKTNFFFLHEQIFNLVVALGSASLIDWVGRRTLFIVSNSGMLVGTIVLREKTAHPLRQFLAFGCWTITEALFNELRRASAAKGEHKELQ